MNRIRFRQIRIPLHVLYGIPSLVYLFIFFYIPMIMIVVYSFWKGGPLYKVIRVFTLENYVRFFVDELSRNVLVWTNLLALLIFFIVILIAYPIAYFLARLMKGESGLKIILLILMPLEMNYLIRIFAWRNILGENGLINNTLMYLGVIDQPLTMLFHSIYAIIIVAVHNGLPYAIFPLYITLRSIPKSLYDAAMDLGSNRISVFFRITLPLSMPGIAIAFLFIYVPMIGEFAIPALVGGKTYLLGNLITRSFLEIGNWPFASAATMNVLILSLIAIFVVFKLTGMRWLYR
ncbi:MAG: ABC transporter permease [Nitrososphaerota archaeon]|nr:ABC transporter permease [Candidatus Geocrenenecus dongiae]